MQIPVKLVVEVNAVVNLLIPAQLPDRFLAAISQWSAGGVWTSFHNAPAPSSRAIVSASYLCFQRISTAGFLIRKSPPGCCDWFNAVREKTSAVGLGGVALQ